MLRSSVREGAAVSAAIINTVVASVSLDCSRLLISTDLLEGWSAPSTEESEVSLLCTLVYPLLALSRSYLGVANSGVGVSHSSSVWVLLHDRLVH